MKCESCKQVYEPPAYCITGSCPSCGWSPEEVILSTEHRIYPELLKAAEILEKKAGECLELGKDFLDSSVESKETWDKQCKSTAGLYRTIAKALRGEDG